MKHKDFEIKELGGSFRTNTFYVVTQQGAKIELPMKFANRTYIDSKVRVSIVPPGGLIGRLKLAILGHR